MGVLLFVLLHVLEIFESSGGNEGAKALHLINLPRTAGSPWFNKIYEAVRCDAVKRTQGLIDVSVTSTTALGNAAFSHCRDRCFQDHSCGFYAFWRKRNWCETYETCTSQSQDGNAQISVYQRLTECEAEILFAPKKYVQTMQESFASGMVRWEGPNKNFHCQCTTRSWMICVIYISPGTPEEGAVNQKLNRQDQIGMKPFFIAPSVMDPARAPICYDDTMGLGHTKVHVELELLQPSFCIPMELCSETPPSSVNKYPFKSGDPVYILQSDEEQVKNGKSVICASVPGMRSLSMSEFSIQNGGFKDPWGREPEALLLVKRNYRMYFIFDQEQLALGICNQPKVSKSARARRKKKAKEAASSDPGSASSPSTPVKEGASPTAYLEAKEKPDTKAPTNMPTKAPTSVVNAELPQIAAVPGARSPSPEILTMEDIEEPSRSPKMVRRKSTIRADSPESIPSVLLPELSSVSISSKAQPRSSSSPSRRASLSGPSSPVDQNRQASLPGPSAPESQKPQMEFSAIGTEMMIMGLVEMKEFNGKRGIVDGIDEEKGRVVLKLSSGEKIRVKPENLISRGALRQFFFQRISPGGISNANAPALGGSPPESSLADRLLGPGKSLPVPEKPPRKSPPKSEHSISSAKQSISLLTILLTTFIFFTLCFYIQCCLWGHQGNTIHIEFRRELMFSQSTV